MTERDPTYLLDMLLECRRILVFIEGADRGRLDSDNMFQYALVRAVTVLGEAASRVSEPTRAELAEIPWHKVIGMRNRLVHEYEGINLDTVWQTATEGVPTLIPVLERFVPSPPGEEVDA